MSPRIRLYFNVGSCSCCCRSSRKARWSVFGVHR